MIVQISAAVAAAAFTALVIYLITFILSAKRVMMEANKTLSAIQGELASVSKQSTELLAASRQLVENADDKLHAFDPMARSVKTAGEALEQASVSVKQVSAAVSRTASGAAKAKSQQRLGEALELVSTGLQLWQRWQEARSARQQAKHESNTNKKG